MPITDEEFEAIVAHADAKRRAAKRGAAGRAER
jgi:hypothetical protein